MALGILPVAAALGPTAAGLVESLANVYSQKKTNESNERIADQATANSAKQAQQQMEFQQSMSSTSYQRAMADMKAAGLNPILAYSQGGASTPTGAQGTVSTARMEAPRISGLSASAQAAAINLMQLNRDQSTIRLQDTQANKTIADTAKSQADTKRSQVDAWNTIQAAKRAAEIHKNNSSARQLSKMEADFAREYFNYNKGNQLIQTGARSVEGVGDAAYSLLPGGKAIKSIFNRGASSAKDAATMFGRFKKYLPSKPSSSRYLKVDPKTGEIIE